MVMRYSIRGGRVIYKNFEAISVMSVLLFIAFIVNLFIGLVTCIIVVIP